jgi:membrane protease YdiL (CAAX protease family)
LAFISGFAIAGGTILLTLITVTGFSFPVGLGERWFKAFPWIILLALGNSLSEGILFRNTLLSVLKGVVLVSTAVLIAASFFGVAHYYGAPRGLLGVVMSSVLGYFLCRSMVDTRGMVAPWFIHFMQDLVIFSTMVMLL